MLVLCLAALVASAFAQSSCSFSDPRSGYSLSWTVNNGQVNFNLTYPNFPTSSYTGVGFGDSMAAGIDSILVAVQGSQVLVNSASLLGYNPPTLQNDRSVSTQSASYINRILSAQFSRALTLTTNNHKSLTGCNTWDFITTPGTYNNGQYGKHASQPAQQQICNIDTSCKQGMVQSLMNTFGFGNQNQNNNNNQMYNQNQQYNQQYNPNMGPGYNQQYNQQGMPMMGPQGQGYNQQGYNPNMMGGQQGYGPQYQPMGPGPQYPPSQYGQGQNYGYQPNTATPPPSQPYTGAPFAYTTTFDPTYGNQNSYGQQQQNGGYNGNMQYMNTPQRNPADYNNNNQYMSTLNYNPGQGSSPQYGMGQGATQGQQYNSPTIYSPYNSNNQSQMGYNTPSSQGNYNGYYSSSNQQQQQPSYQSQSYGRKRRSIRAKRQTSDYQPTNNIYGYDYSNSGSATSAPLVVNPNYKYLSGPLADSYSRSYAQEVTAYDQQQGQFGNSNMNLNGNAPILNNNQQNQANYQQIQQDYARNPNPTAGQTYTNNIYGYNYGSSTPSPYYTDQSQSVYYNGQVQRDPNGNYYNNQNLFYPANPYSSTASPIVGQRQFDPNYQTSTQIYGSGSNLKETRLRDPTQYNNLQGAQRDYIPGTSAQTPFEYTYFNPQNNMFYPYRTSSDYQPFNSTYYDDNGIVHSASTQPGAISPNSSPYSSTYYDTNGVVQSPSNRGSYSQNTAYYGGSYIQSTTTRPVNTGNGILYDASTGRMNDGTDACALQDPYWCDYYVKIFINSQEQYNYAPQQTACKQLKQSLTDSYNGCCNTVRAAGC